MIYPSKPLEMKQIEVTFLVGNNPGFDLNTSALTFGKIPQGSSSTRSILLENPFNFPITAEIYPSENIADLLSCNLKITIDKEPIHEPFTLSIPNNYSFGNYSGNINIYFRKAKR